MAAEVTVRMMSNAPFIPECQPTKLDKLGPLLSKVRACSGSLDSRSKVYRELGLFSLKKKIEDAVLRTEMIAPTALEVEEARRIKQEGIMRDYNLWDDLAKSNDILIKLAETCRAVDALKDLTYKAEEAKLIAQLTEMDAINYGLFEQAYTASVDMTKFLDWYEMLKLLKGPYDIDGASMIIKAGCNGNHQEIWVEQLLRMYQKWAKKLGYRGRVVEKHLPESDGITSVTIEFEFDYAYGFLQGEKGIHNLIRSAENEPEINEVTSAAVDIIPLFLREAPALHINEEDLIVLCPSTDVVVSGGSQTKAVIQHVPTGLVVESTGERSLLGNKIKALNRLKARLLMMVSDAGVSDLSKIDRANVSDAWQYEARRYFLHPHKHVKDVKTGVQMLDPCSMLEGNIGPLLGAHICMRLSG